MTDSPVLDRAAGIVSELVPPVLRRHPMRGRRGVLAAPAGLYALSVLVGNRTACQVLTALGMAGSTAAVTVELADWSTLDVEERRRGVVHLAAHAVAATCFLTSFRLRWSGFGASARVAGLLGLGALAADGYLTSGERSPAP